MKQEIRKALGTNSLIIGTDRCIKALREGKLKEVVLASNCDEDTLTLIEELAGKTKITKATEDNEALGVICKKPFRIAVLGLL